MLNLSVSFIGMIERGSRFTNINNIIKISNLLDISIDYIVKGNELEKVISSKKEGLITLTKLVLNDDEASFFTELFKIIIQKKANNSDFKNILAVVYSYLEYVKLE